MGSTTAAAAGTVDGPAAIAPSALTADGSIAIDAPPSSPVKAAVAAAAVVECAPAVVAGAAPAPAPVVRAAPPPVVVRAFALTGDMPAALALGFVGGYLDAELFYQLFGLFTMHMTGNLIVVAAFIERSQPVIARAIVLAPFIAGSALSAVATASLRLARVGHRASLVLLLVVEAALWALTLGLGVYYTPALQAPDAVMDSLPVYVVGCVSAFAAGCHYPLVREMLPALPMTSVATGNLTGVICDLAILGVDAAVLAAAPASPAATASAAKHALRLKRLRPAGAALVGFVTGAFAGAWLQSAVGFGAMGIPIAIYLILAADAALAWNLWREGPAPSEDAGWTAACARVRGRHAAALAAPAAAEAGGLHDAAAQVERAAVHSAVAV